MKRPVKLKLEPLEVREVPALFGNPWPNAQNLTMSFAPDGTAIAGYSQDAFGWLQPSKLSAEMSSAGTTAQWQTEILRAFQTWAVQTNVNIGLIPDAGSPFGPLSTAPGNTPGGDIRVGAFNTVPDVIAFNQPFSPISGAWGGSLLYNTAQSFSIGNRTAAFDIFTTTLDEAGNILGLADRNDPTSALYGHYIGVKSGLNATDVTAVQSLYGGARNPDAFGNNGTLASAYRLSPVDAATDATKKMVSATGADLTTLTDVDHYVFKTAAGTTSLTVRLETVGKSLLNAKISVYDDKNVLVGTATSAGPLSMQDLVLTVDGVKAGKDYRVRVEKASNDVFGIGRYDLKVGFNFDPVTAATATTVAYASDGGTNDSIADANALGLTDGIGMKPGRIETASDVDFYRLTSPLTTPKPMTVTVNPATPYGLFTKVTVLTASGAVVPSEVQANGADGRVVIQVANPLPLQTYFVKVQSVGRNGQGLIGNYTVTVDFTLLAVNASTVTSSTLTNSRKQEYLTFNAPESRAYYFALDANSTDASVQSGLRMVIFGANGAVVATMTVDAGSTSTATILLPAGTYYLRFEAATTTGAALPNLNYKLRAVVVSDPIDPFAPPDPTLPPAPPPDYTTQNQGDPFYIALGLPTPWLDPWTP